jgi:hypothetical protein
VYAPVAVLLDIVIEAGSAVVLEPVAETANGYLAAVLPKVVAEPNVATEVVTVTKPVYADRTGWVVAALKNIAT